MKELDPHTPTEQQLYNLSFHLDCAFAHLSEMHFPTLHKDPQTRQAYRSLQDSLADIHHNLAAIAGQR